MSCLDFSEDCSGPVEFHSVDPGMSAAFPRCEFHWALRVMMHEQTQQRYGGDVPPVDFDPTYCGESWDE